MVSTQLSQVLPHGQCCRLHHCSVDNLNYLLCLGRVTVAQLEIEPRLAAVLDCRPQCLRLSGVKVLYGARHIAHYLVSLSPQLSLYEA